MRHLDPRGFMAAILDLASPLPPEMIGPVRPCAAPGGAVGDEADHRLLAAALGHRSGTGRRPLPPRRRFRRSRSPRSPCPPEHLQMSMNSVLSRVAADAGRRVGRALRGWSDRPLLGERARTRHDADLAGLEDVARHDADLALAGRHHAGTVRPDQARFEPDSARLTFTMSSTGMLR